jgi:hypothetical protein
MCRLLADHVLGEELSQDIELMTVDRLLELVYDTSVRRHSDPPCGD